MDSVASQQDESEGNNDDILAGPTIAAFLTREVEGKTVLQDKNVGEDNFKMMLALAWDAVSENPELIPQVREGILNLRDSDFIGHLSKNSPWASSTVAALMTHKNEEGKTIMEENTEYQRTNQALLSLAMSALNESCNLIPEVRREIVKA